METIPNGRPFATDRRNAIMLIPVIPAKPGIHWHRHLCSGGHWTPAFAGATVNDASTGARQAS